MTQLHSLRTANHRPYADVYADSTERLAATGFVRAFGGGVVPFATEDLYKKVLQLDNATEWVLTAITPTWVQVSGAGSLANDSITNALLANMAQSTIKGRASDAGTGDPTDLSASQATAILNAVVGDSGSGGTKGLVPAPGAGDAAAGKFLKADGTFAVPSGTGAETGANSDITSMDGLTGALENPTKIIFPEAAAPSTPAANKVVLYAKSDGKLYIKDDAGTETDLTDTGGGGGTNPTSPFVPYNNAGTFADSRIKREATDITALNGGVSTPQTFKVYKTDNGSGTSQWVQIADDGSSHFEILSTSATAGAQNLRFGVTGAATRLELGTGALIPSGDRGYDLGGSGNRWNQAFLFTVIVNGGDVTFTGGPKLVPSSTQLEIKDEAGSVNLGLKAKFLQSNPATFANRPGTPAEGMLVAFTDSSTSTWGSTITGGGSNHVLGYYNGTNWTVAAI